MNHTLSMLLHPVLENTFWQNYFAKDPLYIPSSPQKTKQLNSLIDWQGINHLLHFSLGLKFRLVHKGQNYNFVSGEQNNSLQPLLQQGATLIIEHIDKHHPVTGDLCDAISSALQCVTGINLYLSYPKQAAYPLHYDTHDLLVMQLKGQKKWFLEGLTQAHPTDSLRKTWETPPDNPQQKRQQILNPGDVLYVPRGHWHKAMTVGDTPSLHLTLGMYVPTGLDLIDFFKHQLEQESEALRAPLYPLPLSNHAETINNLQTAVQTLKNKIESPWQEDFIEFLKQKTTRRSPFSLEQNYWRSPKDMHRVTPDSLITVKPLAYTLKTQDIRLVLSYQKKELYFAFPAESILKFVLNTHEFTVQTLYDKFPAFSPETIKGLLLPLFQDNVLSLIQH